MESARAARRGARLGPCAVVAFVAALLALSLVGPAWAAAPPTGDAGTSIATAPASAVAGSVDAGGGHTCGVRTNGTAACWGLDASGEATPPGGTLSAVSAGASHTCGIETPGLSLVCWGANGDGQAPRPPARSRL